MTGVARRACARGRRVLAAAALFASTACSTDRLVEVERPDIIDPADLDNAAGATALYTGVLGELSNRFDASGSATSGIVQAVGVFSDELRYAAVDPAAQAVDQRTAVESSAPLAGVYGHLQILRGQAERAAAALEALDAADSRVGELQAISALTYVVLAELFCSGVPIGSAGQPGERLTTAQLLEAAIAKLDEARQNAGTNARALNLTAVLRGRALLNLGRFADASQAVRSVPLAFSYTTAHSVTTSYAQHDLALQHATTEAVAVSEREGINGLNYATAGDPRVPVTNPNRLSIFDNLTPMYFYDKYGTRTSPNVAATTTIASGVEARLIEAEAALQANDVGTFMAKLNEARAPLPPLTDPGTRDGRVDLLFRERAFAMFLSGHRAGDLRRLVRQYERPENTVFPTGEYHKGGLQYGTDVNLVVPFPERNNPRFEGCFDRNA